MIRNFAVVYPPDTLDGVTKGLVPDLLAVEHKEKRPGPLVGAEWPHLTFPDPQDQQAPLSSGMRVLLCLKLARSCVGVACKSLARP